MPTMRTIGDLIAVLQGIDANIEIKNALQNQDIFDRLKVSFLSSSGETQKAFRQAMKSVPDDNSRNARLLQSISKLDKVSLPAEVEEKFQGSRRNPNSFWSPVTSSLNPVALKTLSPTSSFLEICDFAKSLQGKAFWTHIIWRFLALFFFDISQLYRVNRLHSANANRTSELLEALQIDQRNFGSIGPDLKKWLGAGETYAKLAHALGEGSLFLLPHELTNQHFEQRMSLQSDHFENLLKELKAKGIADESSRIGAQELGRTVRDSIIAPFKVAVGTYAAKQDDVPPKTLKRSSSRKHMQTKKAKSAANKNFQPTSSTARIQDKVSLSMFGVPNSTNTTGIAINSGATHTSPHTEISYGNSTTSPSLVTQSTQVQALSSEGGHEATTPSSHLSYTPSTSRLQQQHVSIDCIPSSTQSSSSASEGNSIVSTSSHLMSRQPCSVQSWYAPNVNGFTSFQSPMLRDPSGSVFPNGTSETHTDQSVCGPLAPGPPLALNDFLISWDNHIVDYTDRIWDPHLIGYSEMESDSFNNL